jgi:uncharacterized membrane protein YidH (DUF202 family)
MNIKKKLLKFGFALTAIVLFVGAMYALTSSGTTIHPERHTVAIPCLLVGIVLGVIAAALDLMDKDDDGRPGKADHDL